MAKIYPAENFFIVPGKGSLPLWKQHELAKDPDFRDLSEQLKGGPKELWSHKNGYALTIRQEAAILKANSRAKNPLPLAKAREPEREQRPEPKSNCCTIV